MTKIILWNIITLDGCFEGERPWDLSFHELIWGPELEAISSAQLKEAGLLVFGKQTYLGMAEYWQTAESEGEVTPLMNGIAKIVCSTTLETASWNNTTIVRDAVSELQLLKQQVEQPIYIFGSGKLAQSLMNHDLIDEIRLGVVPVVLGKGRRLFMDLAAEHKLKLLESRALRNGGVILRYVVKE